MTTPLLTGEIMLVIAVLCAVIGMVVTELVRIDVVAIIMMVVLPILGLVTPQEAFSGLSSNAVVSIIAVIIIGAGLDKTGVMNKVAAPIMSFAGDSYSRLVTGVCGTAALISSFMQNIGAAALFLPATMRISIQTDIPLSRLLMPMGFCVILGGTVTLVGSGPLILLNDLLAHSGLAPFGLFSVTPIGLMLVASGIAYFAIFGKYVLPARSGPADEEIGGALKTLKAYGASGRVYEVFVPDDFAEAGKTIEDLSLQKLFFVTTVALAHSGAGNKVVFSPKTDTRVNGGDVLAVVGHENNIRRMADFFGWRVEDGLGLFREELSELNAGLMEAIVSPRSEYAGATLRDIHFRSKLGISPVALFRSGKVFISGVGDIPLESGDALLLYGRWENFVKLKGSADLLLPSPVNHDVFRTNKAGLAMFCFGTALSLVFLKDIFGLALSLPVCLMAGALLMVLTKVISIDEAYESVDWRTVFLLAGLIPLGIATEKSGTAAYIAHHILNALGDVSPLFLLTVIAILSTVFTLVISNVGAAVLLIPLVINMAQGIGADPRMAALVVALAVSNSFILPTNQVNALLMGPGRYKTIDYIKAGSGMTVIFIVVTVFGLWAFYGI